MENNILPVPGQVPSATSNPSVPHQSMKRVHPYYIFHRTYRIFQGHDRSFPNNLQTET